MCPPTAPAFAGRGADTLVRPYASSSFYSAGGTPPPGLDKFPRIVYTA